MFSRSIARRAGALGFLALSALMGCSREQAPLEPATSSRDASLLTEATATSHSALDPLWPNDDGRSWHYDVSWCSSEDRPVPIYSTREEVPPVPEIADLGRLLGIGKLAHGALADPVPPCIESAGRFGLEFKGQITTLSGVTAQNLVETLERPVAEHGAQSLSLARFSFLSRLARVRPDLRSRLAASGISPETAFLPAPIFLHGYAWEKTAAYIGTYGDLDQNLGWKFLDQNTQRGSSFTFQLVPSLSSDVFLHAFLVPRNAQENLRGFSRELQVVYAIDYGIFAVVDVSGATIGYYRPVDYGTVIYVPTVGPVSDFERLGGSSGAPEKTFVSLQLTLSSTSPGPAVAALP